MGIERRVFLADLAVHALGLALAAAGAVVLVQAAMRPAAHGLLWPIIVYLAGLAAMLGCSALYSTWRSSRHREWLRRLDHAAIFCMIAGTYTPLVQPLPAPWAAGLTAGVWTAAGAGVAAKLWQPRRIEALSVALYLVLGWIGVVAAKPLLATLDGTVLALMLAGGVVYSAGVVFHLSSRWRYGRALWHGAVLAGAMLHYIAILVLLDVR